MPPLPMPPNVHSRTSLQLLHAAMNYFDSSSLLALAKVDHELNRVALERILNPVVTEGIMTRSELVISRGQPVELLSALCLACWIPKPIMSVWYSAARDDIHHFVDDMHRLSLLLSRQPLGSLTTLRLEVSVNTTQKSLESCRTLHKSPVTTAMWSTALLKLLDVALLVGCTNLRISTDYLPDFRWLSPQPTSTPPPPSSSPRKEIIRLLENTMATFARPHSSSSGSLRIQSLTLATACLFVGPFLNYTIALFGRAAFTLQDITFASSPDYCHSSTTWAGLLQSIHLPALKSLTFSFPNSASIAPRDLFNFLHNHPTLITLKLDLRFAGVDVDSTLPIFEDPHAGLLLPELQVLEAWPQFIPWLIPSERRLSLSQRFTKFKGCSQLRRIRILTTDFLLRAKYSSALNKAILSLNSLISRFPSTDHHCPPPSLTLQMNFHDTFWYEWIWTNVDSSTPSSNYSLTKSRLSKLILEIDSSAEPTSRAQVDISLIAEWISLFPILSELEIVGLPFSEYPLNDELCDMIAQRCPRLRRLTSSTM